jgi:hypothetical protein
MKKTRTSLREDEETEADVEGAPELKGARAIQPQRTDAGGTHLWMFARYKHPKASFNPMITKNREVTLGAQAWVISHHWLCRRPFCLANRMRLKINN